MADEMVDVVDESDNIIGKEMKSKCHKEGIWHRVSSVFLFNSEGKIWLQKRAKGKEGAGNFDSSAAGHLGLGDSYEVAAYRELEEEIGIKTQLKLLSKDIKEVESEKKKHFCYVFVGHHDGPFILQDTEVESIKAYSINEVKEMLRKNPELFAKGLKLELNELFKKIK